MTKGESPGGTQVDDRLVWGVKKMSPRKLFHKYLVVLLAIVMAFLTIPALQAGAQDYQAPKAYVVYDGNTYWVIDYENLLESYVVYRRFPNDAEARLAKHYFSALGASNGGMIAYRSGRSKQFVDYKIFINKYVMDYGRDVAAAYSWCNCGKADPGRIALKSVKVVDPALRVIDQYQIDDQGYQMMLSQDAGVKSVAVRDVNASRTGNAFSVTLADGTDLAGLKADDIKVVTSHSKAKASTPLTNDGGRTWTFRVTAEYGNYFTYTVHVDAYPYSLEVSGPEEVRLSGTARDYEIVVKVPSMELVTASLAWTRSYTGGAAVSPLQGEIPLDAATVGASFASPDGSVVIEVTERAGGTIALLARLLLNEPGQYTFTASLLVAGGTDPVAFKEKTILALPAVITSATWQDLVEGGHTGNDGQTHRFTPDSVECVNYDLTLAQSGTTAGITGVVGVEVRPGDLVEGYGLIEATAGDGADTRYALVAWKVDDEPHIWRIRKPQTSVFDIDWQGVAYTMDVTGLKWSETVRQATCDDLVIHGHTGDDGQAHKFTDESVQRVNHDNLTMVQDERLRAQVTMTGTVDHEVKNGDFVEGFGTIAIPSGEESSLFALVSLVVGNQPHVRLIGDKTSSLGISWNGYAYTVDVSGLKWAERVTPVTRQEILLDEGLEYTEESVEKVNCDLTINQDGTLITLTGELTVEAELWTTIEGFGYIKLLGDGSQQECLIAFKIGDEPYITLIGNKTTRVTFTHKGITYTLDVSGLVSAISYDIDYVLEGGQNHPDNPSSYKIADWGLPLEEACRQGYRFDGWFIQQMVWRQISQIEEGMLGPLELHAHWTKLHTVAFDNKGKGGQPDPVLVPDGGTLVSLPVLQDDDHVFEGWYLDDGTFSQAFQAGSTQVWDDTTLYARWTKLHTVTFDNKGKGGQPDPVLVPNGGTLDSLPVLQDDDCVFEGWYLDDDTFSQAFQAGATQVWADTTLYAKWMADADSLLLALQSLKEAMEETGSSPTRPDDLNKELPVTGAYGTVISWGSMITPAGSPAAFISGQGLLCLDFPSSADETRASFIRASLTKGSDQVEALFRIITACDPDSGTYGWSIELVEETVLLAALVQADKDILDGWMVVYGAQIGSPPFISKTLPTEAPNGSAITWGPVVTPPGGEVAAYKTDLLLTPNFPTPPSSPPAGTIIIFTSMITATLSQGGLSQNITFEIESLYNGDYNAYAWFINFPD